MKSLMCVRVYIYIYDTQNMYKRIIIANDAKKCTVMNEMRFDREEWTETEEEKLKDTSIYVKRNVTKN